MWKFLLPISAQSEQPKPVSRRHTQTCGYDLSPQWLSCPSATSKTIFTHFRSNLFWVKNSVSPQRRPSGIAFGFHGAGKVRRHCVLAADKELRQDYPQLNTLCCPAEFNGASRINRIKGLNMTLWFCLFCFTEELKTQNKSCTSCLPRSSGRWYRGLPRAVHRDYTTRTSINKQITLQPLYFIATFLVIFRVGPSYH